VEWACWDHILLSGTVTIPSTIPPILTSAVVTIPTTIPTILTSYINNRCISVLNADLNKILLTYLLTYPSWLWHQVRCIFFKVPGYQSISDVWYCTLSCLLSNPLWIWGRPHTSLWSWAILRRWQSWAPIIRKLLDELWSWFPPAFFKWSIKQSRFQPAAS
jgi:hypothetical protein